MTAVRATTEQIPALAEALELRRAQGLDTYDEWWNEEYRLVTGPSPEHGRLAGKLYVFLDALAEPAGLHVAAPVNIGIDKVDCRVPDLGVYRPDTPRTSPAFLERAELVVEILSPGERSGEKLAFYDVHAVREYLELDLVEGRAVLLHNDPRAHQNWMGGNQSHVLEFRVTSNRLIAGDRILDLRDFRPA